jgi:hypothetical protein
MSRLPAALEAQAFLRRAATLGGHGALLHRGDPDRGAILLLITERGEHVALLERMLSAGGDYRWQSARESDPQGVAQYVERRRQQDRDIWVIELDIVPAERFIAETIAEG